jgi:FKBP-type peptidyl-prolyl cis-trans isomerase SlyD
VPVPVCNPALPGCPNAARERPFLTPFGRFVGWRGARTASTMPPMNHPSTITDGKVVTLHYTLRDDKSEIIESSVGSEPMLYLHGAHNIVPGLEKALTGQGVGYKGIVTVAAADGYGERVDAPPQAVPRTAFPAHAELEPGMSLLARGPNGQQVPVWIVALEADKVLVESQHPLAGVTLHFDVEVLEIRDASADEKAHGHPHGEGGHHH